MAGWSSAYQHRGLPSFFVSFHFVFSFMLALSQLTHHVETSGLSAHLAGPVPFFYCNSMPS